MNIRAIPRTAVKTSLRLARLPFDAAIQFLPGNGAGAKGKAERAVDQADATARAVAGSVMLDSELRDDARRKRAAAGERAKAADLRARAERTTAEARTRAERRGEQAQRRRKEADTRASRRREQAEQDHERKRERAREVERKRAEASRNVERRNEEQIEQEAPERRLEVLEDRAEAQRQADEALTERDEASRLGEAAAAVKEERKQD
jgi:hypothetical protein